MGKDLIKMGCMKAPIRGNNRNSLLVDLIEPMDEYSVHSINLTQVKIPFTQLEAFELFFTITLQEVTI